MTTANELPNGGGWKGKSSLWFARKALALFKRAAMSGKRTHQVLVWAGIPDAYANKLLADAEKQRRAAADRRNALEKADRRNALEKADRRNALEKQAREQKKRAAKP